MALRIGPDGTIINDEDQTEGHESNQQPTVDGIPRRTPMTSIPRSPLSAAPPPTSPLANQSTSGNRQARGASTGSWSETNRALQDLEYSYSVADGKAKSAAPKRSILVAVIFVLMALVLQAPILLIGAACAGGYIIWQLSEKSKYEAEKADIQNRIDQLKR